MASKNRTRASWQPFGPREALLSAGGLGFLRPAPGTWGSLPPVIFVLISLLVGLPYWAHLTGILLLLVVSSAATVRYGTYAFERFVAKGRGKDSAEGDDSDHDHDPAEVVSDEVAGQCLPLLVMVPAVTEKAIWALPDGQPVAERLFYVVVLFTLLPFVWFRVFDILKPWPCKRLEKLPGGWGILMDDLMAGLYALAAMLASATAWHIAFPPGS